MNTVLIGNYTQKKESTENECAQTLKPPYE